MNKQPQPAYRSSALSCLALLWLVGCQPLVDEEKHQGLVYCSQAAPSSFNPQLTTSTTVVEASSLQVYNRLLNISDSGLGINPELAEQWEINEEGTQYTFTLRENVSWHQTDYFTPSRSFNADDVVFSFQRIINPKHPFHSIGGSDYSFFNSVGMPLLIKSITALAPNKVRFELFAPDSTFLTNLASNFSVILSAEYGQQLMVQGKPALIDKRPIGTGPYRFYQYKEKRFIKYKRHETYWKGLPTLATLVYDITPNSTMRLAKLLTGECDVMDFPLASDLNLIRSKQKLRLQYQTGFNLGYWAFNTDKEPFDDARIRQALSMAINREPIMQAVYYGTASPATGILPPASWAYDVLSNGTEYNPSRARQLLGDAGYPDGFDLDIWVMPIQRDYNPNAKKMALLLQQNLRDIGIGVRIVNYDWEVFSSRVGRGEHDTVLLGWAADNADPDNFFRPLLSCQAKYAGTNRSMWCDPAFDKLIDDARLSSIQEQRMILYQQAQNYLNEKMPLLPIAHGMKMQALRSNIHNLEVEAFGGIDFSKVTIE